MRKALYSLKSIYNKMLIRNKISLLFCVFFLSIIIIIAFFTNKVSSEIIINKTIMNNMQNLNLVSEKIDIVTESVENYTKIAILNGDIQRILSDKTSMFKESNQFENSITIKNNLKNIVVPNTIIDTILLYNADLYTYDSGSISMQEGENSKINSFLQTDSLSLWLNTHKSLYQKDNSYHNGISYLKKFYNTSNGNFIGVLEACVDESVIFSLYGKTKIGENGEVFIIDKEGTIVSNKNKSLLFTTVSGKPYFDWAKENEGGKIVKIDKKDYLILSKYNKKFNWIIIGKVPVDEITADNKALTRKIYIIGLGCILLTIIISILISRSITKPLIKLKNTMQLVGKGDLQARICITSGDELGLVANEFNKMLANTSELMDRVLQEQQKKKEYALLLLQSQINPHFLYNTLDNICGLAELGRKEDIVSLVGNLASFYRGALSKGSTIISIKEELKITEKYLRILKMRYGERLKFKFFIDEHIYDFMTIKLVLQPLIENSIQHGLRNKNGTWSIEIHGSMDKEYVYLQVRDNGVGIEAEKLGRIFNKDELEGYETKSFGLTSTDDRIKLYFGQEYGLEVSSVLGEGTNVCLKLPENLYTRRKDNDKSNYCR